MLLHRSISLGYSVFAVCTLPVLIASPAYDRKVVDLHEGYWQPEQWPSSTFGKGLDLEPISPHHAANDPLDESLAISPKRKAYSPPQGKRTSPTDFRRPEGSGRPGLGEPGYNQHSNLPHSVSPTKSRGQFDTTSFPQSSQPSAADFADGFVMPSNYVKLTAENLDEQIYQHFYDRLSQLLNDHWQACKLPKGIRLKQSKELLDGLALFARKDGTACIRITDKGRNLKQETLFPRIRRVFGLLWSLHSQLLASQLPEDATRYITNYIEAQNNVARWFWNTLTIPDNFGSSPIFGFPRSRENIKFGEPQLALQYCLVHEIEDNDDLYLDTASKLLALYRNQRAPV